MKKGFKIYAACWAILLVLFNIICFVSPSEAAGLSKFGGAFWVGYIFITAAFIGQLACAYIAFKAENLKKLFYNLPIIRVSYTGLILTIIFGALTMAIPDFPCWAGAVICLLILAFNAIAIIKAKAAADVVSDIDVKIKCKTGYIKNLTADAESLVSHAKSDGVRAECKKVYEAVRYSDPVSNIALADIEEKITAEMQQLSEAVAEDDSEIAAAVTDELLALIKDRNILCKSLKQ